MQVLIINPSDVRQLLPMNECIDLMAQALITLARGDAVNPLRWGVPLPDRMGVLGMMPAYLDDPPAMGLKAVSVLPGNHGTGYDSHQGAVLLFETEHGSLRAVMDASEITAIRTAAVSGVATRLLARDNAGDLAILGAGIQAASHLEAMMLVRPIRRIRVWNRTASRAARFAQHASVRHNIEIEPVATAQAAVDGADIICTVTSASAPILAGPWLSPGAHINAVGSSVKFTRELDTAAVVMSRLFVDHRESTLNEAGDFLFPRQEGAITDDHIQGEIGDILLDRIPGRQTIHEITLFKSLGLGVEDIAAAYHMYQKAVEQNIGAWVDWGESHHDVC